MVCYSEVNIIVSCLDLCRFYLKLEGFCYFMNDTDTTELRRFCPPYFIWCAVFFLVVLFHLFTTITIFYFLPGGTEFLPGLSRGERGGKEEAGGGHSQSYTVGGGSNWCHPERLTKGNWARQVSSGWRALLQICWIAGICYFCQVTVLLKTMFMRVLDLIMKLCFAVTSTQEETQLVYSSHASLFLM